MRPAPSFAHTSNTWPRSQAQGNFGIFQGGNSEQDVHAVRPVMQ